MSLLTTIPLRAGLTRIEDALAAPRAGLAIAGAIHLAALVVLYETEWGLFHGALAVLSFTEPEQGWEPFQGVTHVSNFARSGVTQVAELTSHGWLDSARAAPDRLALGTQTSCQPARKPPNIILLLDESSFDISA